MSGSMPAVEILPAVHGEAKVVPYPKMASRPAPRPSVRDARLDVLRGLCLVMIFINHVPGNAFEKFTSRNFGFTDAAESFVFMSGISAALAYGTYFVSRPWWPGIARCWSRAWTLYMVHIVVMVWALGIAAAMAKFGGIPDMLGKNNLQYLWKDATGVFIGLPLMAHQWGYVNILPVYAVLIFVSPLLLFAGLRWRGWLVAGSILLWAVSGYTFFNLPNHPTSGGWFFNPFSWQLLFVLGLLTGLALKRGERFVPERRWLFWPAVAYLVMSLVWVKYPPFGSTMNALLGKLSTMGFPNFTINFDKTFVAIPRLLHAISLFYVISCLAPVRWFAESRWAAPLALLGRQALPVFALGTVLSFMGQAAKLAVPSSMAFDVLILSIGLALQFALAGAKDWSRRSLRRATEAKRAG
ncbi:MAG: OpgC family protein [Paracoccaceae bacterium]